MISVGNPLDSEVHGANDIIRADKNYAAKNIKYVMLSWCKFHYSS